MAVTLYAPPSLNGLVTNLVYKLVVKLIKVLIIKKKKLVYKLVYKQVYKLLANLVIKFKNCLILYEIMSIQCLTFNEGLTLQVVHTL